MSDIIKTEQVNGYTVNLKYDYMPDNPRSWDCLGTMYFEKMRNYQFQDEVIPEYWIDEEGESWDISDEDSFKAWREYEGDKLAIVLPIYMYEHSGVVLRTTQTTPRGVVSGYIALTEEKLLKEYGKIDEETIKTATEALTDEVNTYNQYINGEVYYSEVMDGEEFVDGSGGFYDQNEAWGTGVSTAERLGEADQYKGYILGKSQVGLIISLVETHKKDIEARGGEAQKKEWLPKIDDILSRLSQ